jgi:hypothetical protein
MIDISTINENDEPEWNVAVINMSAYKTYETLIDKFQSPVTSIEWIEDCILQKQFFWPNKQLINKNFARESRNGNTKLKLVESDIDEMIQTIECSNKCFNFLQEVFIYFPGNLDEEIQRMAEKITIVGGGMYIDEMMPNVTHIVTSNCTAGDIKEYTKARNVQIVSPEW